MPSDAFFPPKTFSFSSVISYPSSAGERKAWIIPTCERPLRPPPKKKNTKKWKLFFPVHYIKFWKIKMDLEKNYPTPRTGRTGRTAIRALGVLTQRPSRALALKHFDPGGGGASHFRRDWLRDCLWHVSFLRSVHTLLHQSKCLRVCVCFSLFLNVYVVVYLGVWKFVWVCVFT